MDDLDIPAFLVRPLAGTLADEVRAVSRKIARWDRPSGDRAATKTMLRKLEKAKEQRAAEASARWQEWKRARTAEGRE
jgi:hypothetical protein